MYTLGQATAPGTPTTTGIDDLAKIIAASGQGAAQVIAATKGMAPVTTTSQGQSAVTTTGSGSNMGVALAVGAALVGLAIFVATRSKSAPKRRRKR